MTGEAKPGVTPDLPRVKSPYSEDEEEAIWAQLRAWGTLNKRYFQALCRY